MSTRGSVKLKAHSRKIGRKLQKALRHPILLLHANKSEVELSRIHAQLDLRKAEPTYQSLFHIWNPARAILVFRERIKCYPLAYLYAFCRYYKPETVVETGVGYGHSSAFMLKALQVNGKGHLYSIDLPDVTYTRDDHELHHDALPIKGTTGCAIPPELRKNWTLIVGDSRTELPKLLSKLGSVDLFHHDSKHTYEHMTFEYETVWSKLAKDGLLLSDDVTWNTAFTDFFSKKEVNSNILGNIGFTFKK